jgi:hypothetical protein
MIKGCVHTDIAGEISRYSVGAVTNSQDSKNTYLQRTHTLSGGRGDVRAWNIYSWLIFELEVLCVLGKWNQNQNRRASKRRLNARARWNNKDGRMGGSVNVSRMNLTSGYVCAWDGRESPNLGGCRIRAAAAAKFQMNWTVPYTGTAVNSPSLSVWVYVSEQSARNRCTLGFVGGYRRTVFRR